MADQFAFSKRRIEALTPPAEGRDQYRDTKVAGLVLRVTAAGTKTFSLYKKVSGRPLRSKLGVFPEMTVEQARDAALGALNVMHQGGNPAAIRRAQRDAPTVQTLFDQWLEHAKLRKKTWQDDRRQFDKYMAKLKNRKLADITTADVSQWHAKLGRDHGHYQANRCRALLSAMFGIAHEVGYEGANPCEGVKRFRETSRERFLQPDELRPFFRALAKEPDDWRDFWLLCLFCGARRGNVAAMAWKDIDLAAGVWYLPGQKTKNGLPMAVVLSPPAVAILQSRQDHRNGHDWVFPAEGDSGHVVDPRKSWARVTKSAGIENLRPHDLRRSLGSWQAIAGASLQIVGASLGHRDPKATAVYSRLLLDPVRTSVNQAVSNMQAAGGLLPAPPDQAPEPDQTAELLQRAATDPAMAEAIRRAAAALAENGGNHA